MVTITLSDPGVGGFTPATTTFNTGDLDDTTETMWEDIDKDGWKLDDVPTYKGGKIVDPMAKKRREVTHLCAHQEDASQKTLEEYSESTEVTEEKDEED